MKFQEFLFGCVLNGVSVAKYTDVTELTPNGVKVGEKHCVQIIVEKLNGLAESGFDNMYFFGDSEEAAQAEFAKWLDTVVSDEDATYNKDSALNCVIEALRNDGHYRRV